MKQIFLLGDSIRYGYSAVNSPGYGVYVKQMLEKQADVYAPDENCRFAQYTLRYLHAWAAGLDKNSIDVVHWNCGLWDVLRLFGDDTFTPLEFYLDTLKRIELRIEQLLPNAQSIFALSTTVIERLARPDFSRRNDDIARFNGAAEKLLTRMGVKIDDLYSISQKLGEPYHADWAHFNDAGCRALAETVTECIRKYIEI